MTRSARLVVPYYPHHVVHRGHNREPVFVRDADYRFYLDNLDSLKRAFDCRIYAFCLMPNHVHLMIDPGANPDNLARLMKHLAGRQARYANRMQDRSGSLWEGRFRSSPVAKDYVIPCCEYIELNPVRAYLAAGAGDYRWSSRRARLGLDGGAIDPYPAYLELQVDRSERCLSHLADVQKLHLIREAIQCNGLTGDESFRLEIEREAGLRLDIRRRGRPKRREDSDQMSA